MSEADAIDVSERSAFAGLGEALENAAGYLSAASSTAGASVKTAAGKTGAAVSVGTYKAAYGVSYGIVFGSVFLKELLPERSAVRRGFEAGAEAAFEAAHARKAHAPVEVAEEEEEAPAAPRKTVRRKPAPRKTAVKAVKAAKAEVIAKPRRSARRVKPVAVEEATSEPSTEE